MLSPTALTKIILRPDANIVIDETSVPNTVSSLIPPIINPGVTSGLKYHLNKQQEKGVLLCQWKHRYPLGELLIHTY